MNRTTTLLIEAGIIPKNTLQQLINWRLVPEGSEQSHGKRPATTTDERSSFAQELSLALTQDLAEIRETELDLVGDYETAVLNYDSNRSTQTKVFVDKLGRVILPFEEGTITLPVMSVSLPAGSALRKVVRSEMRYLGDKPTSQVLYLENLGGGHGNS
jgi:hypothetical protein